MKEQAIVDILSHLSMLEIKQPMTAKLLAGQLNLLNATNAKTSDYINLAEDARIANI
ncbi:TPA: hypothetical protein ACGOR8_001954 [Streptococcus suis]